MYENNINPFNHIYVAKRNENCEMAREDAGETYYVSMCVAWTVKRCGCGQFQTVNIKAIISTYVCSTSTSSFQRIIGTHSFSDLKERS